MPYIHIYVYICTYIYTYTYIHTQTYSQQGPGQPHINKHIDICAPKNAKRKKKKKSHSDQDKLRPKPDSSQAKFYNSKSFSNLGLNFCNLERKIKEFSPKLHQPAEFHKSQQQATTAINRVKDNQKEAMMPFSLNRGEPTQRNQWE